MQNALDPTLFTKVPILCSATHILFARVERLQNFHKFSTRINYCSTLHSEDNISIKPMLKLAQSRADWRNKEDRMPNMHFSLDTARRLHSKPFSNHQILYFLTDGPTHHCFIPVMASLRRRQTKSSDSYIFSLGNLHSIDLIYSSSFPILCFLHKIFKREPFLETSNCFLWLQPLPTRANLYLHPSFLEMKSFPRLVPIQDSWNPLE